MRKILLVLILFLSFFSFHADSVQAATGTWGGTIQTGDTCIGYTKTFNSCYDPQATCDYKNGDINSESNPICFLTSNPQKDSCAGYDPKDPTHTQQTGICYYSKDDKLPSCSDLTAADYHQDKNYHHISDDIISCSPNSGHTYQCCAPNAQPSTAAYPPPPCTSGKDDTTCASVNTGIGPISTNPASLIGTLVGILLGISGGIATVIIIISGYRIIFSRGDPEKLKAAQEAITSAIIGLLFIIFSVVILRIIGVDLLHIPGLTP